MHTPIGVGIIGVSPTRGWAATAHIPALRALANYEIRALSASNPPAATAVGNAFAVPRTFSDYHQLVVHPAVDLVVVTVKVPDHLALVAAALNAGKAVYCEWPLGRTLAEAEDMANLATAHQVPTIIGLQGRQAPAIAYARELVISGYLGGILSTTMVGAAGTGAEVNFPHLYMLDIAKGANLLTINVGHSIDALTYVLGEFREVAALSALRRPHITLRETGESVGKTAADQIAIMGTLASGATVSMHFREGLAGGTGFLWEMNGTKGTLQITAASGVPEILPLTLWGAAGDTALTELAIPERYLHPWPALAALQGTPADNVGRTYAAFAQDQQTGTQVVPNFAQAVTRHKLLAVIAAAASSGTRVALP